MKKEEAIEILSLARFTGSSASELDAISEALDVAIEALKAERPHGEWILTYPYQDKHMVHRECSLCGDAKYIDDTDYFVIDNFCPNCGASMVKEGEAE